MSKRSLTETRTYKLETVSGFWNFLIMVVVYFGLLAASILIHKLFLVLWVLAVLLILGKPESILIFRKRRTIKLYADSLEIIETKKRIYFENIIWYNDQDSWWYNSNMPTSYFSVKEKNKLFSKGFKIVRGGTYFQNFEGFKRSTINRIHQINPESIEWIKTRQGKVSRVLFWTLGLLSIGIFIYESPYLFLGILTILIFLVVNILRNEK